MIRDLSSSAHWYGRKNIPLPLPREVTKNFKACKAFIDQHTGVFPTEGGSGDWLLDKAQRLAQATNTPLPDAIKGDRDGLKKFVEEIAKKRGTEPATPGQMDWVKKLVEKGATPPEGYPDSVSKVAAGKFLDEAFAKKAGSGGSGGKSAAPKAGGQRRPAAAPAKRFAGAKK